ncbi:unnamed protein product [Closterium sp. NIES-53]
MNFHTKQNTVQFVRVSHYLLSPSLATSGLLPFPFPPPTAAMDSLTTPLLHKSLENAVTEPADDRVATANDAAMNGASDGEDHLDDVVVLRRSTGNLAGLGAASEGKGGKGGVGGGRAEEVAMLSGGHGGGGGGLWSAVFNLTTTSVGAGIMALPATVKARCAGLATRAVADCALMGALMHSAVLVIVRLAAFESTQESPFPLRPPFPPSGAGSSPRTAADCAHGRADAQRGAHHSAPGGRHQLAVVRAPYGHALWRARARAVRGDGHAAGSGRTQQRHTRPLSPPFPAFSHLLPSHPQIAADVLSCEARQRRAAWCTTLTFDPTPLYLPLPLSSSHAPPPPPHSGRAIRHVRGRRHGAPRGAAGGAGGRPHVVERQGRGAARCHHPRAAATRAAPSNRWGIHLFHYPRCASTAAVNCFTWHLHCLPRFPLPASFQRTIFLPPPFPHHLSTPSAPPLPPPTLSVCASSGRVCGWWS